MKIAIIISNPEMGGAQRVSITLAEWLIKHNVCVRIVGLTKTSKLSYTFEGIDYVQLSGSPVRELRSQLRDFSPNLVLTMGVPLCVYTIPACLGLSIKHIVSERNDPANFKGRTITKHLSRMLMKLADGYVFQTSDARDFYSGKIAKNSVVIPNPLMNAERMPCVPNIERREEIVSVGRLNLQKNHRLLVSAFKKIHHRYQNLKLVIWGEGDERNSLQEFIDSLDLGDFVSLPGNSNNIFEKIYQAKLFVLSSDFEGMPNALMEAMALGLPCISTDCPCGGPSELIKNNENGILIPVGDENELAKAMTYMLDNEDVAEQLGRNAKSIREHYSIDSICKRWYSYFSTLIQ